MKKPKSKLYEWQNRVGQRTCAKCGIQKECNVDHIIPVHLLEQLGLDRERYEDEKNFQYLCFACNRFKASKLDLTNPKTMPLLKKYVEMCVHN